MGLIGGASIPTLTIVLSKSKEENYVPTQLEKNREAEVEKDCGQLDYKNRGVGERNSKGKTMGEYVKCVMEVEKRLGIRSNNS